MNKSAIVLLAFAAIWVSVEAEGDALKQVQAAVSEALEKELTIMQQKWEADKAMSAQAQDELKSAKATLDELVEKLTKQQEAMEQMKIKANEEFQRQLAELSQASKGQSEELAALKKRDFEHLASELSYMYKNMPETDSKERCYKYRSLISKWKYVSGRVSMGHYLAHNLGSIHVLGSEVEKPEDGLWNIESINQICSDENKMGHIRLELLDCVMMLD